MAVGTGSVQAYPLFVRRAGGAGSIGLSINNVGPSSTRDAIFTVLPDSPSVDTGGISFSTHNGAGGPISNAVYIQPNGNVGINTTASAAGNKLEVVGNISASTYTGNSATYTNGAVITSSLFISGSNSTASLSITNGGIFFSSSAFQPVSLKLIANATLGIRTGNDQYASGLQFGQGGSSVVSYLGSGISLGNGHPIKFTGNTDGSVSTDVSISRSGSGVLQIGDSSNNGSAIGSLLFSKKIINLTASALNLTGSDSNTHCTNSGSSAQVDFALPLTASLGATYTFTVTVPQTVRILANTGSFIYYGITSSLSNGNLTSNTTGSTVMLTCLNNSAAKSWTTVSSTGIWTVN